MKKIAASELIINGDGSVFHLHLKPGDVSHKIILVGDPARVDLVVSKFDRVELRASNREFATATGYIGSERLSVVSTGIGTDNIDIVITELDALVNVDFATRTVKPDHTTLFLTRLGTSGALQPDISIGDFVLSKTSVGFDSTVLFYADHLRVCDSTIQRDFLKAMNWNAELPVPYFINSSERLNTIYKDFTIDGMTISAPGFYGAQGRAVRLGLTDPSINRKLENYRYQGQRITNYEMEGSALAAMAAMLGHHATTICAIIAQRTQGKSDVDYKIYIEKLIENTLKKLVNFQ